MTLPNLSSAMVNLLPSPCRLTQHPAWSNLRLPGRKNLIAPSILLFGQQGAVAQVALFDQPGPSRDVDPPHARCEVLRRRRPAIPTETAPPRRNATMPSATMNAQSVTQAPAKAVWR